MGFSRRTIVLVLLISALGAGTSIALALGKKDKHNLPASQMEDAKRALHALNRLTFGPRPGDVQRVLAVGIEKWIDEQLHPDKIDDHALEARLAPFRTLLMDTREIVENFPPQQVIKAIAEGKQSMPSDSAQRAVYRAQLERYEQKKERKEELGGSDQAGSGNPTPSGKFTDEQRARRREERFYADVKAEELLDLPPDQRFKEILKMSPEEQRAFLSSLKGDRRDEFMEGMDSRQRETLMALNNPQQVVTDELFQGKLLRAIYSERQLDEVMTDFWFNHFNVFIGKGADRYLLTSYERDVIRPHALGKFEDLLVATAQSPAMLFYLDNWLSVGPNSDLANGVPKHGPNRKWQRRMARRRPQQQAKGKRSGLNENYGRELMELHTVGVSGGYTQKDVTEVARTFTGWTLKQPKEGGGFIYEERMHEPGDKTVLGHRIKSGGGKEGREVLHLLARHPATARFICTKLAMRFVSDNPPASLVDRMSQTFLKKDGDMREVLKAMLSSPEFWSPDVYRAKVKTPLEFVASAVRASGGDVADAMPLARQLQTLGMPLYGAQPPTGYSMKGDAWVSSASLLGRMNFALALTGGKLKGVRVESGNATAGDPQQVLAQLENVLLAGEVSKQTHETIAAKLDDPAITQRKPDEAARGPNVGVITGLLIGSPEFQRR
jgi:uncharacterized protein (DUF1800 family)